MSVIVSRGSDFVVEYLDRSFNGGRRTVLVVSGEDGSVAAGGLSIDEDGAVSLGSVSWPSGLVTGEWTYISVGADGTNADHISGGLAGSNGADLNVVADNKLFLTAYLQAKLEAQAGPAIVKAPDLVHIHATGAGGPGTGNVLIEARTDITANAVSGTLLLAGGTTSLLRGYTEAKVAGTAGNVVLKAVDGVALGSNGGLGCYLTLDGSVTGKPVFALGQPFTAPSGTDSQKITAIIAILNTLGLFTAP